MKFLNRLTLLAFSFMLASCEMGTLSDLMEPAKTPTVVSINQPLAGNYSTSITFNVTMSEAVIVTGTPRILVYVGPEFRYALYNSAGSTDTSLEFVYTISPRELDTNGVIVEPEIELNGGAIKSVNGTDAQLSFTAPDTQLVNVGNRKILFNFQASEYALDGDLTNDITLYAGWSFARNSISFAQNLAGTWVSFAADAPRITDKGFLIESARTNKCTNFNANPTDGTNMTLSGDAAAVLTVVDDTVNLNASGLGQIATSGKVFEVNNSGGVANAFVDIAGVTANTSVHNASVFARGGTGSVNTNTNVVIAPITTSASYSRFGANFTPATVSINLRIQVNPGQTMYFILNQLEQGASMSTPIVIAGASATRPKDNAKILSLDHDTTPFTTFVDVDLFSYDSQNRYFFEYTDGTADNRYIAFRSSTNRAAFQAYSGNVLVFQPNRAGYTGARTIKIAAKHDGTNYKWAVDNILGTPTSAAAPVGPFTNLYLGQTNAEISELNGYLKKFEIYNEAMNDTDLQAITQ